MFRITLPIAAEILRLYSEGMPDIEIAQAIGTVPNNVRYFLRRRKLPRHQPQHFLTRYDGFFATIDTWAKAYCLGFIAADGCVLEKSVEIGIHQKDIAVLEYIRSQLQSQASIEQFRKKCVHGPYVRFRPGSVGMVTDLKKHGITERKSLSLLWPTTIPDHLLWAFLLGYFDGDGSVGLYENGNRPQLFVIGSWPFILSCQQFLLQRGIIAHTCARAKGKMATVQTNSFLHCVNWLTQMYAGAEFCLERKHKIALEIIKHGPSLRELAKFRKQASLFEHQDPLGDSPLDQPS